MSSWPVSVSRPAIPSGSGIRLVGEEADLRRRGQLRHREPQMGEALRREETSARRALEESLLDQVRLDNVLNGVARFRQRGGDRLDPDRPAPEIFGDDGKVAAV